ncbi:hypothetical protein Cgig2_027358 [Carnegiea gigantea]|uniref:Uncharacterized protein n=1 Tax=Carnegiea gigantea TaxID=171969 RepID=A0A9Q1GIU3_9CARY|nr:hypothetical protein Cgig2_027358 [Carnegiea gigantea]
MSPQPDSRRKKRKSYFQYFTFDFFSMVVMKPGLLLKQYHPRSRVSLGAFWTICMRHRFVLVQDLYNHKMKGETETIVKGRTIDHYTFCKQLIHGGIRLKDHEGIPSRQERVGAPGNSDPFATISVTSGARPFHLSTNLPGPNGTSEEEELVDALSEDELFDKLSEKELDEVVLEVELELVEAISASWLDENGAKRGLPCVPSTSSSSRDLMHRVDSGHITSTSGLRMLEGEEYWQLDHEGVSGSKRGTA